MTHEALRTATRAYQRFAHLAADADRTRPTQLDGWSVGELIDHVTWGAAMEAAALGTAASVPADQGAAANLTTAVAAFDGATRLELAPTTPVVLPAGTVPMAYAAPLFAFEAALHAHDLEHALTGSPSDLAEGELAASEVVLGPLLDLIGTFGQQPEGVVIDLIGLSEPIRLEAVAGTWRRGVPDDRPATTTIAGAAQDLVLFVCGRTAPTAVEVTGDPTHAASFKAYFPGP